MNHPKPNPAIRPAAAADGSTGTEHGLAHWVVSRAARRLPELLCERLEEEWRADLGSRSSSLSRLRFALGCCWATRVISLEHCASPAPLASPASGGNLAIRSLYGDLGLFSRRSSTLVLVLALHVAVFYALLNGLKLTPVPWTPPPLVPHWIPAEPHQATPLPLPDKLMKKWQLDPPLPEFSPTDGDDDGGAIVAWPPDKVSSDTTATALSRVPGRPGAGFPDAEDFYPSAAKRLEEQGASTVRVCVDVHGRLTSAPTTVQSSGSSRLDAGALLLARAGSGHYLASTEDGRAVDSCFPFRIRFRLRS